MARPPSVARIPIVVGEAPAAAIAAQAAKQPKQPGSIESLLDGPPIIHWAGKIWLNPIVFGHLAPSELSRLEGLGIQSALKGR